MWSLYREEPCWLHRISAAWKLLALALLVTGLTALPSGPPLWIAYALANAVWWSLGEAPKERLRVLRMQSGMVLLLVALHLWVGQWRVGLDSAMRLLVAMLLGMALTRTTPSDQLLAVFERLLSPLSRLGVHTDRLALHLALMLRHMERLWRRWEMLDAAHRHRMGRSGSWRLFTPLMLDTLRGTMTLGDALRLRWRDGDSTEV